MSKSKAVDKALKEIAEIEAKFRELDVTRNVKMDQALEEHLRDREPLLQRRYELVSGRSEQGRREGRKEGSDPWAEPTPEELKGFKGATDAGSGKGKGLPFFWLNVLSSQDLVAETITRRDRLALERLSDVRFVRGQKGLVVEFHFLDNEFFENKVLRKGLYVEVDSSGQLMPREEATEIDWKEGNCLLTKEVKKRGGAAKKGKKGKKGGKGGKKGAAQEEEDDEDEGPAKRRFKACPSFFRFFTPLTYSVGGSRSKVHDPTADEDDEEEEAELEEAEAEDEAVIARRERDADMLEALMKQVVPKAVHLYLEGPLQTSMAGDQDEENEEEEGYEHVSGLGCHGGDVTSLTLHSQQVIHALKGLQEKLDALMLKFKRAKWDVLAEKEAAAQQLYDQRRALLVQGDEAVVPNYWLRALRGMEMSIDCLHPRDERALSYLADVRLSWDFGRPMPSAEDPTRHATLELHFRPGNTYFANRALRKRYVFQCAGGSMRKLAMQSSDVPEGPAWVEGKDLTTRAGPDGKPRPAASFFALFKKGSLRQVFNITGEDKQSQQMAAQMEEAVLQEIQYSLLARSQALYEMVDLDDELPPEVEEEDEEEEEEEGEEEEGGEEGEEGTMKAKLLKRGQRSKAAAAAASSKAQDPASVLLRLLVKRWPLVLLFLVVGLAYAFVFIDLLHDVRAYMGL